MESEGYEKEDQREHDDFSCALLFDGAGDGDMRVEFYIMTIEKQNAQESGVQLFDDRMFEVYPIGDACDGELSSRAVHP